jgi:hypothetical protein
MKHVISVLTACIYTSSSPECLQFSFDIISNVIGRIDFVGRKRNMAYNSFLEDFPTTLNPPPAPVQPQPNKLPTAPTTAQTSAFQRELYKLRISRDMSNSSTVQYTLIVRSLLPILHALLHEDTMVNRSYTVRALDILSKLVSNSDNDYVLQTTPQAFLTQLAYLLTVNTTRCEPLVVENFLITGDPLGRTRPPVSMIVPTQSILQSFHHQQHWQYNTQHQQQQLSYSNNSSSSSVFPGQSGSATTGTTPGQPTAPSTIAPFYPLALPPVGNLFSNAFLSDQCDVELRDYALDCLVSLCKISYTNRHRLLQVPNILPLLFRIANLNPATSSAPSLNVFNPLATFPTSGVPTTNPSTVIALMNPSVPYPPISSTSLANTLQLNRGVESGSKAAAMILGMLMESCEDVERVFGCLRNELMAAACHDEYLAGKEILHEILFLLYRVI